MNPHEPPFDLVGAEVALHRAARVARLRAKEMRRIRVLRRLDSWLDFGVRARIVVRDTLRAWRAGAIRSTRDRDFLSAEVALHRAARVARRRAASMPRRRAETRLHARRDEEVRAKVIARFGSDPAAAPRQNSPR